MKKTPRPPSYEPHHEDIAVLAHQIYEDEGCPSGKSGEHWAEAHRRLCEQSANGQDSFAPKIAAPKRERLVAV